MMEETKFKPIKRSRSGRFQITVWERPRVVHAGSSSEETQKRPEFRASIQHSEFNHYSKIWLDRALWCDQEELVNLAKVLEELKRNGDAK